MNLHLVLSGLCFPGRLGPHHSEGELHGAAPHPSSLSSGHVRAGSSESAPGQRRRGKLDVLTAARTQSPQSHF